MKVCKSCGKEAEFLCEECKCACYCSVFCQVCDENRHQPLCRLVQFLRRLKSRIIASPGRFLVDATVFRERLMVSTSSIPVMFRPSCPTMSPTMFHPMPPEDEYESTHVVPFLPIVSRTILMNFLDSRRPVTSERDINLCRSTSTDDNSPEMDPYQIRFANGTLNVKARTFQPNVCVKSLPPDFKPLVTMPR